MIKKTLATVAIAASAFAVAGAAAAPAMAIGGDEEGTSSVNGNGSDQVYGNTTTGGYMSPNISLVNGSLNKPCIAVPNLQAQNIVGLVNVGLQDVITGDPQQNCTENSTQTDGDDPLSHILSDLSLLSENGVSKH
ncbi:rodlin [Streptomyces sp. RFCAC02]|uniref:rodlin n=1 Tax=Streptomyces sp. RFCAC02 TaxID=2499143 RepID=UPI00101EB1C2|nr:rodlin [Streptomyces sp. RFCAC02]